MICQKCGRCQTIHEKGEVYEIGCLEKGGFRLHSSHEDNSHCEDYVERIEVRPPKDNVYIVLKCGRDYTLRDEGIKSDKDILDRLDNPRDYAKIGNLYIMTTEVVAFGYME